MQKLPVIQVIREAFDVVWLAKRHLLIALIPSVFLYYLTVILIRLVAPAVDQSNIISMFWAYISIIALIPVYTIFAVTIHRLVLLGPGSVPWYGQFPFSKRELKFGLYVFGTWVAFYIVFALCMSLIGTILADSMEETFKSEGILKVLVFAALLAPAVYVFSRVSLGFPAIATDNYVGWKQIWMMSQGNSLRLFVCTMTIPWIYKRITDYLPDSDYFVVDLFYLVMWLITVVVEIAIVSISYKYISMIHESRVKEVQ